MTATFHSALGLYDGTGRLRADLAAQRRAADALLAACSRAALLTRTDGTAAALEDLHDRAQDLWHRPNRPWAEIDEQCRRAELAFRKQARAELGLPTRSGLPEPTPPPRRFRSLHPPRPRFSPPSPAEPRQHPLSAPHPEDAKERPGHPSGRCRARPGFRKRQ